LLQLIVRDAIELPHSRRDQRIKRGQRDRDRQPLYRDLQPPGAFELLGKGGNELRNPGPKFASRLARR